MCARLLAHPRPRTLPQPPAACPRLPRRAALPLTTALVLALIGCSQGDDGTGQDPAGEQREGPDARVDPDLWVDPDGPAPRQVAAWEEEGRVDDAETLRLLAEQPIAEWPSTEEDPRARIREVVTAAGAEEQTAVFVAYNVPHRDCGQYSQGGAADEESYRAWIESFASGIGDSEALVILEPDAVPHIVDGCTDPMYHEERYSVLSDAVDQLGALPNTRVYLDAGNPSWITEPGKLAEPLWRSGLKGADGFALNVSNYQHTDEVIAYGHELSDILDGAHFVIDTSRNGNGALAGDQEEAWCNPPGRGLGEPPTLDPDDPLVDAYLWIKRPGESDGECRGGPQAGVWWPEYALGLARESTGQ